MAAYSAQCSQVVPHLSTDWTHLLNLGDQMRTDVFKVATEIKKEKKKVWNKLLKPEIANT